MIDVKSKMLLALTIYRIGTDLMIAIPPVIAS